MRWRDVDMTTVIEKYQVAGLDERERGFNRLVEVEQAREGYRATFRYETTVLRTSYEETSRAAMLALITHLHERGYSQLRTRLSFRGDTYLGSQELWEEHGGAHSPVESTGLFSKIMAWFRPSSKISQG